MDGMLLSVRTVVRGLDATLGGVTWKWPWRVFVQTRPISDPVPSGSSVSSRLDYLRARGPDSRLLGSLVSALTDCFWPMVDIGIDYMRPDLPMARLDVWARLQRAILERVQ